MSHDYRQLLYDLERVRTGDADSRERALNEVTAERRQLERLREEAATERDAITALSGSLQAQVPDLRATGDLERPIGSLTAELDATKAALAKAARHRESALSTAQLPSLLPRAHHFIRNLVVYGAAMLSCLVVQLVMLGLITTGILPSSVEMWVVFILPVVFLLAGYIATGIAGSPRMPMVDQFGKEIQFTVYKSPRLGVALAVFTMVGVLLWNIS